MYKIQWWSSVLLRYTRSILGLRYTIQVIMERRRNGGGKGKGEEVLNVLSMHREVEEGWSVFKLVEHAWVGSSFDWIP